MEGNVYPKRKRRAFIIGFAVMLIVAEAFCTFVTGMILFYDAAARKEKEYAESKVFLESSGNRALEENGIAFEKCLPEMTYLAYAGSFYDQDYETECYTVIKNDETGENTAEPYQTVYFIWIFPKVSKEAADLLRGYPKENTSAVILTCPYRCFEEFDNFLQGEKTQNMFYHFGSGWESREGGRVSYTPMEIYINENGNFLPGKIRIRFYDPTDTLCQEKIWDFAPEQTEGFRFINLQDQAESSKYYLLIPSHGRLTIDGYGYRSKEKNFPYETWEEILRDAEERFGYLENSGLKFDKSEDPGGFGSFTYTSTYRLKDCEGHFYTIYCYTRLEDIFRMNRHLYPGYFIGVYIICGVLCAWIFWFAYHKDRMNFQRNEYCKMLVDCMAHDLKTPLTVMGGCAENLKENLHEDKREYYADNILSQIGYMNEIIAGNRELSRLETEKKLLKRVPVNLTQLIRISLDRNQERIREKNLQIRIDGDTVARGDAELLQRVFDNLIQNAVKYSTTGGEIRILGGRHRLSISNTAEFSYEGKLDRLWEAFVRGEESRSGEKGTGLGLYIAAEILKRHKWKYRLRYCKKQKIFTCRITF